MSSRSPALLIVPLLLASCLQEGPEPKGAQLFHSQTLAAPGFMKVGDETMVRFQDRRIPVSKTRGAVSDLWISSFDGTRQRKVVSNWSQSWAEGAFNWWKADYPAAPEQPGFVVGEHYYMTDEHLVEAEGGMARVASLVRLGQTMEEDLRLEGVWTFVRFTVPLSALFAQPQPGRECPGSPGLQNSCPQILFERPMLPGQKFPTLLLWNGEQELELGPESGSFQTQWMGDGTLYFITGETHMLTRFLRPLNLMEGLHANVIRFLISGDERYAAVQLAEEGKSRIVVLDLVNKTEIALARPNPSGGWSGFDQDKLYYSQLGSSTGPAELHTLNLLTGEDTFETLPPPLTNLAGWLGRPDSDERLLLDGSGHGVFTSYDNFVARRVINGPLHLPNFTKDGAYLVYIERAASTLYETAVQGALMFQDAEFAQPPIMVSPPGLLVSTQNGYPYFFTEGDDGLILVFWAHLGRGSSDLYFADYKSGSPPTNLRLMARAILSVSISAHSLFGIVNMSQQDAVGDLVVRDFDKGTDRLYSQAVSEAAEHRDEATQIPYAAYIVRGRTDSDRSGLWLTTLTPPGTPDGGSE
jgi:hypothetical protein